MKRSPGWVGMVKPGTLHSERFVLLRAHVPHRLVHAPVLEQEDPPQEGVLVHTAVREKFVGKVSVTLYELEEMRGVFFVWLDCGLEQLLAVVPSEVTVRDGVVELHSLELREGLDFLEHHLQGRGRPCGTRTPS